MKNHKPTFDRLLESIDDCSYSWGIGKHHAPTTSDREMPISNQYSIRRGWNDLTSRDVGAIVAIVVMVFTAALCLTSILKEEAMMGESSGRAALVLMRVGRRSLRMAFGS